MKKKIMLIVPMLHQGGFERVCVATARLLEPFYEVYIVIFSSGILLMISGDSGLLICIWGRRTESCVKSVMCSAEAGR